LSQPFLRMPRLHFWREGIHRSLARHPSMRRRRAR
jgi:hypothetical protein